MTQPKITQRKLKDYRPSESNNNQHTERGLQVIEDSIQFNGAGRSGLVDKNGVFIAGAGTWESMARAGIEDVLEVNADGKTWVIVKRTDLEEGDPQFYQLMLADNRASELGYAPAADLTASLLGEIAAKDGDLRGTGYEPWEIAELDSLLDDLSELDMDIPAAENEADESSQRSQILRCLIHSHEVALFEQALALTGEVNRADALSEICRFYVEMQRATG